MENSKRLQSLDFFRGITIAAMILVNNPGSWAHIYAPFEHAEWHGWTPTDLIFPFFLFIVGVSINLAMSGKKRRNDPKIDIYKRVIRRTLLLIGLGWFMSLFPFFNFSNLRVVGVLPRIGICYLIVTIIFLHSSTRTQIFWTVFFLFLYWGLMEWYPVPEIGAGLYEKGANFSNYVDSIFLKGHMWSATKTWDPEGIISTLPAFSTTLFGILTGHLLLSKNEPLKKVQLIIGGGLILTIAGLIWSIWLPINKSIWTSSYSVFTAGLAMICLGISYYIIDIKNWHRGVKPFVIYGMNAITVFVISGLFAKSLALISWTTAAGDTISLKSWIFNTFFLSWLSPINASLLFAIAFIAVFYLLVYVMYQKKIFIKV